MLPVKLNRRGQAFLIGAIIIFLCLDTLMLTLNFQITRQVTNQTLVINLAGRQRMLSQTMAKHIFAINPQKLNDKATQENLMSYISASELFADTLRTFKQSGYVIDAEKQLRELDRIDSEEAQAIISKASASVKSLNNLNSEILRNGLTRERYQQIRTTIEAINTPLLEQMNQLTVLVQKHAEAKTQQLRIIQFITFILALISFAFIIYRFRRTHVESEQTINILSDLIQSAKAALIIFDKQGRIIMSNESARALLNYDEDTMKTLTKSQVFNLDDSEPMVIDSNGQAQPAMIHNRELIRENTTISIATIIEKSQYLAHEHNLFTLANRNALTGMLNHNALNTALYHKTQQGKFLGGRFACFYIHVENYNDIVHKHGHKIGDDILKELTYRLCSVTRESDFIYHINGHEFVVITDLNDHENSLATITKKISGTNYHSFNVNNTYNIDISLDIGSSICPDHGTDPDTVLLHAKNSMKAVNEQKPHQRDSQVIDLSKASKNRQR